MARYVPEDRPADYERPVPPLTNPSAAHRLFSTDYTNAVLHLDRIDKHIASLQTATCHQTSIRN
jgi:hypothetical protein